MRRSRWIEKENEVTGENVISTSPEKDTLIYILLNGQAGTHLQLIRAGPQFGGQKVQHVQRLDGALALVEIDVPLHPGQQPRDPLLDLVAGALQVPLDLCM